MNFGDLKSRIRDSIGAVVGELDTEIEGFALDAISDIWGEHRWSWDLKSGTFLARGDIEGLATWVLGATTITVTTGNPATQALCDEYVNGLVKLNGNNVYTIQSWVQSTAVLTVSTEIIEPSTATGPAVPQTAAILQDMNTLPAVVDSIVVVRDYLNDRPLELLDGNERRRLWPDPFLSLGAISTAAWQRGVDAAGNVELGLYPPPTADAMFFFEFYRKAQLPVADGDELLTVTGIPTRFHPVIVARGKDKAYEHERENGDVRSRVQVEYQLGIQRMKAVRGNNEGAIRQVEHDRGFHGGRHFDSPIIPAQSGLPFGG